MVNSGTSLLPDVFGNHSSWSGVPQLSCLCLDFSFLLHESPAQVSHRLACSMLLVSTTQGVYNIDGQGASRCLGLEGMTVSQIAVQGNAVLAAVPELAEVRLL